MRIEPAEPGDIPEAAACMAAAFASDPIAGTFFHDSPLGRSAAMADFFGLLLEARIALGMPALVVREANRVSGLVMGYDCTRPAWPAEIKGRWDVFAARHPALEQRFAAYDAVVESYAASKPHFYLGALGVQPSRHSRGLGKALVQAFLDLAEADPSAQGTFLETANEANLGFYQSLGFEVQGSGPLDATTLWCLFRPRRG